MARSLGRLIQLPESKMVVSTFNITCLIMQKLTVRFNDLQIPSFLKRRFCSSRAKVIVANGFFVLRTDLERIDQTLQIRLSHHWENFTRAHRHTSEVHADIKKYVPLFLH